MAIIRSTYHSRLQNLANQTRRIGDRMARAQDVASTGLAVSRGSDAPGRMSYIHAVRESRGDQSEYVSNAKWSLEHLTTADTALSSISSGLSEARELAVQMSSETYNAQSRVGSAVDANGILARILTAANANLGGRYVFSGDAFDAPAFDAVTGLYLGDNGQPEVAVADGNITSATGFDGSNLLQGGGDVVAALQNLETALLTGNAANVQPIIDELDLAIEQVSVARTIVGGEMQRAEDGMEMAQSMTIALASQESNLVDANAVDAFTHLFEVQQAFEAALQVTANSRSSLLFSRL